MLSFIFYVWRRMQEPILEFSDVGAVIGKNRILQHVSFKVPHGHLFALLGPNGAGKTTIIRVIGGIWPAKEGEVKAFGEKVSRRTCDALRARMGFQTDGNLYRNLTVKENLQLWGELYSMGKSKTAKGIQNLAEMFSFGQYLNYSAGSLSKGTKQKILVARALLADPQLLMLDEPTSGMDIQTSQALFKLLRQWMDEQEITIVLTTHILQELHYRVDDVAFISKGTVIKTGNVKEIMAQDLVKTYELTIQDDAEALQYLSTVGSMEILGRKDGKVELKITSPTIELNEVTKKLILSEVSVYDAHLEEHTIEDLYSNVFSEKQQ